MQTWTQPQHTRPCLRRPSPFQGSQLQFRTTPCERLATVMASSSAMRCMSKQEEEPSQLEHGGRWRGGWGGWGGWGVERSGSSGGAAPDLAEEWKDLRQAQMEHLRAEVRTLRVEMQQAAQRQDTMQQKMVQMQQMLEQMQQMLVQQQLQPVQQPPAKAPPPPAVRQPAPSPAAVLPPPGLPPTAAPPPPPMQMEVSRSPHQCTFHSPQASANLPTVELSGGRPVYDEWTLDNEFASMESTLFFDDTRGADELHSRLRSDFKNRRVKIICARTSSGSTRWWHTQCLHCLQFNHVEYGKWVCQTPEDKAKARQKLFLWHCPPIQSAPRIAPGAALPAGKPQV